MNEDKEIAKFFKKVEGNEGDKCKYPTRLDSYGCGYKHLPLEEKKRIISKLTIPEISVCEDVTEHYDYWVNNFNPNKEDCCNLDRRVNL